MFVCLFVLSQDFETSSVCADISNGHDPNSMQELPVREKYIYIHLYVCICIYIREYASTLYVGLIPYMYVYVYVYIYISGSVLVLCMLD